MEWVDRMNAAVDYIEEHLCGEIDGEELAKRAACSEEAFRRTFSQVTGVSVAEYIRRRKLTCAAGDLQNSNERVIDIAMKYGYDSADAFRVAFRRLHGVTPMEARAGGVRMTFYCRINLKLTIRGVDRMDYKITARESFKVIGVRRVTPYGGGTWAVVKTDGSNERIHALSGRFFDLGLCFGFLEDGSDDYMCAVAWDGEDVPGYESYTYEPHTWLEFTAKGKISEGVLGDVWRRINTEFLPQSKYSKCAPTIERYVLWDEEQDLCHVDILLPVELKE